MRMLIRCLLKPLLTLPFLTLSVWAAQVPFILPWNDQTPTATDLSAWNPPIASTDRVSVNDAGQFEVNGERIRFLGMNFTIDAPFSPTNKADGMAARLSKFGINCVRLHHIDPPWAYNGGLINYSTGTSRTLQPQQLDKIHWLISRLKAHGVYVNMNLLVSREFRAADGLPSTIESLSWKDQHIVGFFNDTALALHQEYATQVLTPVNPHTGLSLAEDPVVAFVEIINENGIIQKWFEGVVDSLPAPFSAELQSRWNEWLASEYADDAALLEAWAARSVPLGPSLLRNGNFANGLTYWNTEQHDVARASFTVDTEFSGQPAARIQVTTPGTANWHVQLNQPGIPLSGGQLYTLSFHAKADRSVGLDTSVMQAHADWQPLGYSSHLDLTTEWQTVSATFEATQNDLNARPNFGGFATSVATVWIADVQLRRGGTIGELPDGVSLVDRNIPIVPEDDPAAIFTREARRDWLRFLVHLENRYYDAMIDHLRTNCGYPGLIFGTIIANSPPNVQGRMDVVDGHSYWQHPQFPGNPWDSVNWFVNNVSMVNSSNGGTLGGLARQRVQGKPFTVTEYQHSSPNYYGAEGPLLIAAYGALQDWDGIWMFDYGRGNDSTSMGYFHGFFDTAQHPTKMANLLLAAALFRRGDVEPAHNESVMEFSPDTELDAMLHSGYAWGVANGSHIGVPAALALQQRLSLAIGDDATGLTDPPAAPAGPVVTSDTDELRWDTTQPDAGLVTVNTPRSKAVVGFSDQLTFNLGGIQLQPGASELGWSTLGLALLEGESFTNTSRTLLVAAGKVDNAGMQWTDPERNSVGNQWGTSPVLAEVVPFTLTLPLAPSDVEWYALDEVGQRRSALPVTEVDGQATLTAATSANTIWYEIVVTVDSPFDQWRQAHFSPDQLADPEISGETAAPAADGIPNLLKYSYGLGPFDPLTQTELVGGMDPLNQEDFPTLTFKRSKTATDIEITPEISVDFSQWTSDPGRFTLVSSVDLGEAEEITFRDSVSLAVDETRFLRLRVERRDP